MDIDVDKLESVIEKRINSIFANDKSVDEIIKRLVDKVVDDKLLEDVSKIVLKSLK